MGWMRAVRAGAVAVALAACDRKEEPKAEEPPPGPSVVGRWRGAREEVELFASGRLLLHQGAYRVAGSYEFVEPGRMLLVYQNALAAVPPGDYRVAVTADSLALCETDAPTRCVRYARVTARDSARGRTVVDSASSRVAQDSAAVDSAAPVLAAGEDGAEPRLAEPLRPEQLPYEARSAEAGPVLKQAYVLQETYRQMHDRYAVSMDELRDVGWQPLPLRHFHQPEIAGDAGRLCMVMRPRAADLWPVHIDSTRTIARGDRCD